MDQKVEPEYDLEPVRGSIFVLAIRLFIALIIFEGLYTALFALLQIGLNLPIDWHHHVSLGLLIIGGAKIFFELWLVLYLLLQWAANSYFMTSKHIVKRAGIISSHEEVYHFDNIRSINVKQSFLGKLFNYGDLDLKISASGGYQEDVVLSSVSHPRKYETKLKAMF